VLLKFIDVDEYASLFGSAPPLVDAMPDDVIRVVKKAIVDKSFRNLLFDMLRQAFGREFELYELRKFFATWMISQGVPESIVNTLQGRAPPSEFRILVEHYWSPRHEELRQMAFEACT